MAQTKFNRQEVANTGVLPAGYSLISDTYFLNVDKKSTYVTESKDGVPGKIMKISGLFQRGNAFNENTRYYDTDSVLKPAIEEILPDVKMRSVIGELDHPDSIKINLDRASHLVTSLNIDGDEVYGEAEVIASTPMGAILRGLLEHKVRIGVSSRGAGQLEQTKMSGMPVILVLEGFKFITWDIVAKPSVSDAIIQISEGLMHKLGPIQKSRTKLVKQFGPQAYENLLLEEINSFFGIK